MKKLIAWIFTMSLFSLFSNSSSAFNVEELPKPWDDKRSSIYAFIKSDLKLNKGKVSEKAQTLPDDDFFHKDKSLRWVAGGLDGAFGHHAGPNQQKKIAKTAFNSFLKAVKSPNKQTIDKFYQIITEDNALDFIDPFLELAVKSKSVDSKKAQQFAKWLATESPDRGAVKVAIAILGLFPGKQNSEIFLTLGRHEEFTLYSAVAIQNTLETPELELWEIAKSVDGWGRIQVVERLANTQNEQIKQWMLREGYKNSVMYEYLAYTCAVSGELVAALKQKNPDDELLKGAGDIIDALIMGGPAEDMDEYNDGAEAVKLYIDHLERRDLSFEQFLVVDAILRFVKNDKKNLNDREERGWTANIRTNIATKSKALLAKPDWRKRVKKALDSEVNSKENLPFYHATKVAEALGIDTWDYYYKRQKSGNGEEWYNLMRTNDEKRIDKVIALAESIIPLDEVASGPGKEMGLGKEFQHHSSLDFIVQDIGRFPGKGWKLVKASLNSPVIRNRNMSLRALSEWGKDNWPNDAKSVLEKALKHEPDDDVRKRIESVLKGKPLD